MSQVTAVHLICIHCHHPHSMQRLQDAIALAAVAEQLQLQSQQSAEDALRAEVEAAAKSSAAERAAQQAQRAEDEMAWLQASIEAMLTSSEAASRLHRQSDAQHTHTCPMQKQCLAQCEFIQGCQPPAQIQLQQLRCPAKQT